MEIAGVDWTGSISVADAGGWQAWQTLKRTGLSIGGGGHVVRLVVEAGTVENGGGGN